MVKRFRSIFSDVDGSDLFYAMGSLSLFVGGYLAWPPLGFLLIGSLFIYTSNLLANAQPLSKTGGE